MLDFTFNPHGDVTFTTAQGLARLDLNLVVKLLSDAKSFEQFRADFWTSAHFDTQTKSLREYKSEAARRAILDCNGNKTQAAKKLQISRAYLHQLTKGAAA